MKNKNVVNKFVGLVLGFMIVIGSAFTTYANETKIFTIESHTITFQNVVKQTTETFWDGEEITVY